MGKRKYRFEQIAINCTQKKLPTEEDYAGYIGLEHLESGSLNVTRFGSQVPLKGEKLVMHKGDVLFGKRNAYLRRAAVCPHDGIFSAHGMVLQPREDVIDKSFFPLFISSDYFFDEVIRISVGSLSPTVNWKDLKDVEFDLPDLEEQKKLAEVLWSINDVLEAYRRLISTTDSLVKSQFIEMFGNPITNDKHWKTQMLKDVAPECSPNIPQEDKYWWLNLDAIESNSGRLIEKVIVSGKEIGASTSRFDDTMVLYSKLRPYLNKVMIPDGYGYSTSELVGLKPNENILRKEFLFNILRGDEFVAYANSFSIGGQMPRMPMKKLREFLCVLPPIELQDKFISFSKQVDKSKFEIEKALNELKNLYQMIIKQGIC